MEQRLHDITDEMIGQCEDAQQLLEWRREFRQASNKLRARLQVMEERFRLGKDKRIQEMYVTAADVRSIALAKIETIDMRLRVLRGTMKKPKSAPSQNRYKEYFKYLKAFKSVAKASLDETTFNAIDVKAREESGYDIKDLN